jgi:TldD protein
LGRGAVADARANVLGKARDVEMAPNPGATSGDWSMPIIDDPFTMDPNEIFDYLSGLQLYMFMLRGDSTRGKVKEVAANGNFVRQQKAFGSSDGQFVTQRVYRTGGSFGFGVYDEPWDGGANASGGLDRISLAGAGFEYLRHDQMREWASQLYEDLKEERFLPIVPVDVGRYLSLIHPTGVGQVLKHSVGIATEIDRVMGYEANATGTSYIIDPDDMVGSLKIGAPAMHVTGTRSSPGGLAHVKWDDEGVAPNDFALIQNGVLQTLQTNREGAGWMKTLAEKTGQPIRSHGCAYGAEASDPQVVYPADLLLHPDSARDTTLDQLREQMDKGIEFKPGTVSMDFQQSTGLLLAPAFKIEKGKRVARIAGPGMLFRTSELWGNLQVLGGKSSVVRVGSGQMKGEPVQFGYSSVDAPPALFKEMSVINPAQKA